MTNPTYSKKQATFIQISDCHIDDDEICMGVNTHQHLNSIVENISKINTSAVLISGDLTHNGTSTSYQLFKEILSPIDAKMFVFAGNHDNIDNLSQAFNSQLFSQFTLKDWCITHINSVQIGKTSGHVTQQDLQQLDARLNKSSAKYHIITLHHPIVPMNSTWDDNLSLENPDELFEIIDKHPNIKGVIFGHAHESSEFERNGIKIISCPSTALQFTNEKRIGFNSYSLFDDGTLQYNTQWT